MLCTIQRVCFPLPLFFRCPSERAVGKIGRRILKYIDQEFSTRALGIPWSNRGPLLRTLVPGTMARQKAQLQKNCAEDY